VAQLIAIQISQSQRDTTIWRNLVGHRVEMEWQRSRAQDTRAPEPQNSRTLKPPTQVKNSNWHNPKNRFNFAVQVEVEGTAMQLLSPFPFRISIPIPATAGPAK